ncbi:hypothetical protein CR513_27603, partial [Mucuna pruriens]
MNTARIIFSLAAYFVHGDLNEVHDIVDKPKEKRTGGCKWIYNVKKCKFDGTLYRYRERWVAKKYTQTYDIDYEETFFLVAKMNTVRIIFSLAAYFVHGDLNEVYMEIPPGFESHGDRNKVCKLKKVFYGLKQSP